MRKLTFTRVRNSLSLAHLPEAVMLAGVELPSAFLWYRTIAELKLVREGADLLLQFGLDKKDPVGVNIVGGAVERWDAGGARGRTMFVNSSVQQFVQAADTVAKMFPLSLTRECSDWPAVAEMVRAAIEGIDMPAVEQECFWAEFLDDVEMGSYDEKCEFVDDA